MSIPLTDFNCRFWFPHDDMNSDPCLTVPSGRPIPIQDPSDPMPFLLEVRLTILNHNVSRTLSLPANTTLLELFRVIVIVFGYPQEATNSTTIKLFNVLTSGHTAFNPAETDVASNLVHDVLMTTTSNPLQMHLCLIAENRQPLYQTIRFLGSSASQGNGTIVLLGGEGNSDLNNALSNRASPMIDIAWTARRLWRYEDRRMKTISSARGEEVDYRE